MLNKRQD
ncbi:hypothetical protein D030_3528A, partial [Vibrio parahaemolyticus AQ3810]